MIPTLDRTQWSGCCTATGNLRHLAEAPKPGLQPRNSTATWRCLSSRMLASPCLMRNNKQTRPLTVQAAASTSQQQAGNHLRVELESSEFSGNLSFGRAEDGRDYAIVVSKVEPGSTADKEGVKKGQKLLAISSPMQSGAAGEMWTVNKRPSLRFVQDAVRMNRSGSITLELTEEALLSSAKISNDASMSLMDSMEEAILQESRQTVGQQLANAYKEDEESAFRDKSQRDRRIKRRKEYMERESTRDNTKFLIGLAASFFLPAAGILAYAFSSGLMDRIGNSYRPY